MRHQGRVAEWNDDRGFGFVMPNGGGPRVFLHISALAGGGSRPSVGVLVTYELGRSSDGRPRAEAVRFVGASAPRTSNPSTLASIVLLTAVLLAIAYVAWVRLSHPGSTVPASIYKIFFARQALRASSEFQCSPQKSSCSAMTSCAEALFHQERCGVPNMDGDHDGIPCEQQWCN
jgi:cold shock CspA family protein